MSDDDIEPVSKSTLKGESPKPSSHDANKLKEALNVAYENLIAAQNKTAAFTMMDCRNVKQSRDVLASAIEKHESGAASFGEDEVQAINTLVQGANVQQQQKPAVFTFDGSIDLLEKLELLQEWVRENRSPSQKLKDARDGKARGKKSR